ncbi:MAG: preprotein translocase subunit SecG [Eubacterium sp.]
MFYINSSNLTSGRKAGRGLTGAISGAAESYWGKNKGRSMEGKLEKATKVCVVLFFVISVILNMGFIKY